MAASGETVRAPGARGWISHWSGIPSDARYAAGMVAALAYYYLVPNPLLALPGLVAFAALAWLRLELALCLLPLTFPFWYVPKRALGQAVFPLSEIALGVCLAAAAGHLLARAIRSTRNAEGAEGRGERRERQDLGDPSVPPPFLSKLSASSAKRRVFRGLRSLLSPEWGWLLLGAALLLVGTTAGVLVAVRPREALRAFRWDVAEPLLYAGLVIVCLWKPRVGFRMAHVGGGGQLGARLVAWLAGPALALGALFGALAIVQVLWLHVTFTPLAAGSHLVTLSGASPLRANGIFYGSPNSLGALLERVLPLALALLLWRVLGGSGGSSASSVINPSASRREALVLCACLLVMVIGLALTESRGAEVGAAVGLLLVLLAHPRTRHVALGIVLLGVVVALWQGGALLRAAMVGHGGSGEVRLLLWQSALHMIRDHPLLGIGPDQFLYYYDPAYTAHPYWIPRVGGHLTPAASQPGLAHPHNLVLDLWLSGGMLGLVGFALVVGWLIWSDWRLWAWRASRRTTSGGWSARTALVVGVVAGVVAGLAHGMADSAYFVPDLALLFWWAVAVVALARMPTAAPASSSQRLSRAPRVGVDEASERISGSCRS